jgi:hypothetical protein
LTGRPQENDGAYDGAVEEERKSVRGDEESTTPSVAREKSVEADAFESQ